MNRLNPQLEGKLLLENENDTESLYGNEYSFRIIHIENDCKVYGDDGYLNYNAKADELSSYHINYTENPNCQSVENAIGPEEAQRRFMENFGLRLSYMSKHNGDGDRTYIPVRFVSEMFGKSVGYTEENGVQTITIND